MPTDKDSLQIQVGNPRPRRVPYLFPGSQYGQDRSIPNAVVIDWDKRRGQQGLARMGVRPSVGRSGLWDSWAASSLRRLIPSP